jgi:hypothetical protein
MSGFKIQDDAQRWRQALDRMGVDFARETLRQRPHASRDERFNDLVPDPPYPTRGFVEDWVLEQENRVFRLSRSTIYIILAAVAVLILGWFATSSLQGVLPQSTTAPSPAAQAQMNSR